MITSNSQELRVGEKSIGEAHDRTDAISTTCGQRRLRRWGHLSDGTCAVECGTAYCI